MAAKTPSRVRDRAVLTNGRVFIVVVGLLTTIGCGSDSPTSPGDGTVTLTGFVRETAPTEAVVIAGARVEIIDPQSGLLTGWFVMTDSRGAYEFPGLSGSLSFRATKDGYEGDAQRVHLLSERSLNFSLMPTARKPPPEPIVLGQTHKGNVSTFDPTCTGKFFALPCKRFALVVAFEKNLRAQLHWEGAHDLDLELWRDDTFVVASLTCQACGVGTSDETFTTSLSPGDYEVRVRVYEGSGTMPFDLMVSQAN